MSRYEWEKGYFVLPSSEYSRVRRSLFDALNEREVQTWTKINQLIDRLIQEEKGHRNVNWRELLSSKFFQIIDPNFFRSLMLVTINYCLEKFSIHRQANH